MPVQGTIACVTGATGFLGSEVVAQLLESGYQVHATVRSLANVERNSCLLNLPGADSSRLTLLEADLLDEGAFDGCVAGARYVFHTASPFVTNNITDPGLQLIGPALNGTRNVFGSIRRAVERGAPPPRVVLTSSIAALLGRPDDKAGCFDESDWNLSSRPEGNPQGDGLDMYRYSKVAAEREAWRLLGVSEEEQEAEVEQDRADFEAWRATPPVIFDGPIVVVADVEPQPVLPQGTDAATLAQVRRIQAAVPARA